MTQDGFVEAKSYRRLGKRVIHSDLTEEKLAEVTKVIAKDSMDVDMHESDNNFRDLSTCGALHSIGSDLTRTRGKSDAYRNGTAMSDQTVSKRKEHEKTPSSNAELLGRALFLARRMEELMENQTNMMSMKLSVAGTVRTNVRGKQAW